MENPGECSVCFTPFDDSERRPRTLPCGHTFCSPCIGDLKEGGQLSCPNCRAHHSAICINQFPINFGMEALMKQLRSIKLQQTLTEGYAPTSDSTSGSGTAVAIPVATFQRQAKGISKKLQSVLEEQKSTISNMLTGSQEVQSQLDQYRALLADWRTQHLQLKDRLNELVDQNSAVLELLEEEDTRVLSKKEEGEEEQKRLEAAQQCLQDVNNTAQKVVTAIDQADQCTVEAEYWLQNCRETFPDINTVSTSRKVRNVTRKAVETMDAEAGVNEDPVKLDDSSSIMDKVQLLSQMLKDGASTGDRNGEMEQHVRHTTETRQHVRYITETAPYHPCPGATGQYFPYPGEVAGPNSFNVPFFRSRRRNVERKTFSIIDPNTGRDILQDLDPT